MAADVERAAPQSPTIVAAMQSKIRRRFSTKSASDESKRSPAAKLSCVIVTISPARLACNPSAGLITATSACA